MPVGAASRNNPGMRTRSFRHTSTADGLPLFVRCWSPDTEPKASLLIAHGLAEHGGRYAWVAERFVAQGYEVWAPDHRGHGQSVPPGGVQGFPGEARGWDAAVEDLVTLGEQLKERVDGRPNLLLAHSMGSFYAQQLLWQVPRLFHAVALSGSNGPPPAIAALGRLVARVERARLGPRGKSALLHRLSFGDFNRPFEPARTPMDWLSRDEASVDAYLADPDCGFVATTEHWVTMLDALGGLLSPRRLERLPKELPLYLVAGSRDPVGNMGRGVERLAERYREAGLRNVTVRLWPEARHEVLNERNREEVLGELLTWCAAVARA